MRAAPILRRLAVLTAATTAGAAGVALAAGLDVRSQQLGALTVPGDIAAKSCTLAPVADADVDSLQSSTNYGSDDELRVRSSGPTRRSFVRFDVASCVPAGARILSASLSLHVNTAPSSSRTYRAERVTADWTEPAVTWAGQPAVASQATSTTETGTTAGVRLSWSVTPDVQAFADGSAANRGWRIADADETNLLLVAARFAAREHATGSHRPTLTLSFHP